MLVAAAVCPCPPLLVPEVAAGAAPELAGTRDACAAAVGVLAASRPDLLVVVGPADPGAEGPYPAGTPGSFRGFGVDLAVRLGSGPGAAAGQDAERDTGRELPYALAVGAWLLGGARWDACAVAGLGVTEELTAADAVELGRTTGVRADRVALLVMGDGSACRTLKAPGYLDERAEGFDTLVSLALGGARHRGR
ncbi:conserved hypothetical protein [Streptomyces clavuligerus]|nr:conserved hypothetical protein [Streptomyces clavuligerus]